MISFELICLFSVIAGPFKDISGIRARGCILEAFKSASRSFRACQDVSENLRRVSKSFRMFQEIFSDISRFRGALGVCVKN